MVMVVVPRVGQVVVTVFPTMATSPSLDPDPMNEKKQRPQRAKIT